MDRHRPDVPEGRPPGPQPVDLPDLLDPDHDTCTADCQSSWITDDAGRAEVWRRFADGPAPVGYDPAIIPVWSDGPTTPRFAGLRLEPWRLRVVPATAMAGGAEDQRLTWSAETGVT